MAVFSTRTAMAVLVGLTMASPLAAQTTQPTQADRAAIAACIALTKKNAAAEAATPGYPQDEKPGAAARLQRAAQDATSDSRSCIGSIANACSETTEGQSTYGMVECSDRELAVWDERLNNDYKSAVAAADPNVKAGLLKTQRAWLAYRDALCALPALDNAGGSIVGPLTEACLMDATARQALSLEDRVN
jgi:uncharacterized protein YecT (DUF1311 family)